MLYSNKSTNFRKIFFFFINDKISSPAVVWRPCSSQ